MNRLSCGDVGAFPRTPTITLVGALVIDGSKTQVVMISNHPSELEPNSVCVHLSRVHVQALWV